MKIKTTLTLFFIALLFTSCKSLSQDSGGVHASASQTQMAVNAATTAMEEAKSELMEGKTVIAVVEKAVEEALSTVVSGAVAETLTAIVPLPSITPSIVPETPTFTPTDTPENTPSPSDTPTQQPTETLPPPTQGSQVCYQVIDNWCSSHQGCSTVDVRNQTGMNSRWHIWSDKEAIDATFTIPAGPCTIVTRPGKYNFYITYCNADDVADFSWVLNDNWWYKLSPCD